MTSARRFGYASLATFGLLLAVASPAHALNVQLLRPSIGAVQGYRLFTSETLPKFALATGLEFNYVQHPIEVGITSGGTRITGLVDRFVTADALASFGAADWATVNLDIPFNLYHNIAPIFIPARDTGGPDMGDIGLNAKFRIFDANTTAQHLGLAAVPFVTFPTGRDSVYFGDRWLTGGLVLAGDAQWKANRFYLNVGVKLRKREQIANLVVKHELLYGLGFERPIWKAQHLDVIAELTGSTTFSKFFTEEITSPLEAQLLVQKKFLGQQQLVAHLGAGLGIDHGYGAPDFRIMTGVGYTFVRQHEEPKDVRAVRLPSPERFVLEGVTFETGSAVIRPASRPILDHAVEVIATRPDAKVTVVGHTDDRGTAAANQTLSERRTNAVKEYFVAGGIAGSRITTVGRGAAEPIADNTTAEGRAQNHRIELQLE